MIRVTTIAALTVVLLLVLYLPSAHPPQRFLASLQAEHAQLAAFWSQARAVRILSRAMDAQASTAQLVPAAVSPVAASPGASAPSAFDSAVGTEMTAVNARLFNSPYFRSVDALLLLATYRLFAMLEWLPWLAMFCLATFIDAAVVRSIKAKQFAHHSPEAFAACITGAILLACSAMIGLVLPVTQPALLWPAASICMAVLVGGSMRNFHARG